MKFLKVKSISDVITNSSTEVFMMRDNEDTAKVIAKVKESDFWGGELRHIRSEKDLGDFLKELISFDTLYLLNNCTLVSDNYLSEIETQGLLRFDKKTGENWLGNNWEKTFDYFKKPYLPLIGYVIVYDDNNYTDRWEYQKIQEECRKIGNYTWSA